MSIYEYDKYISYIAKNSVPLYWNVFAKFYDSILKNLGEFTKVEVEPLILFIWRNR